MKHIYLVLLLVTVFIGFGQNIDSLKSALLIVDDKSDIYNKLSEAYKASSELIFTKQYADSAIKYSVKHNNLLQKANGYINLGDYHYYTSSFDSSIYFYKLSIPIYQKLNNSENLASAYSNIGAVYYSKGSYNKAIKSFNKSAKYQKLIKNNKELAIILNNIATVYYITDKYSKAIDFYGQSLQLKKESKDNISIAKGLNNIANVYGIIGDYKKSINLYFNAIKYCDKSNDKILKATTLNNIAGVYKDWKQYDKALELYNRAFIEKNAINDIDGKANILNNIGIVYKLNKDFDKAEKNFIESKEIFEQIGNKKRLAIVNSNLGSIKEQKNDFKTAIELYLHSTKINKEINIPKNLALDYLSLSRVYLKIKDISKSEVYINKCNHLSNTLELNSIKVELYKLWSELYMKKGNYKKSLEYYISYSAIKDSIFTTEKHKILNEINTKYETEKKNQEIGLLHSKNKNQILEIRTKRQERNLWIGISILAIIFASISVYFFINKKKLSEKLAKTLGEKDVLLREIHHRVKNNLQIISSLLNMQSRFLDDDKSKEIVAESQNRIKSMSLIHQKLYQEENLTGIETRNYFTELIDSLCLSYGIDNTIVKMEIDIENLLLDVDTAIPLGLILNEIISNAFKYGVDTETGVFRFSFKKISDTELLIKVKDNGTGIPKNFDIKKSKSYGMKLIQSLSKKLKAETEFINNNGLEITMKILKFKIAK